MNPKMHTGAERLATTTMQKSKKKTAFASNKTKITNKTINRSQQREIAIQNKHNATNATHLPATNGAQTKHDI